MTHGLTPSGDILLSRADLTAAKRELDSFRAELADAAVERIMIARLERLIASATVVEVDVTDDGVAGLGSVVRVRDHRGREVDYELVGRLSESPERAQVTPASPVGERLMGARGGDVVSVALPDGRARTLTVVAVRRGR